MAPTTTSDRITTPYAPQPAIELARRTRDRVDELRARGWQRRHPEARLDQPFFVVGCPRSGTSITVQLLARHPDVANFSEAGRVWDPSSYDDPAADHCRTARDATPEEVRRIHARFERRRQREGKPWFLNKHPRNSVRLEFLDAVFPDARYLHVVRDGRAVASSLVNLTQRQAFRQELPLGGFCKPPGWADLLREDPYEQAALQWREIVRYVHERRGLLAGRMMQVRYEDLCSSPGEVLSEVAAFAGWPESDAWLRALPVELPNQSARFPQRLTARQIHTIEHIGGDLLQELGYDLHDQVTTA